jgi:hypothetical protein
MDVGRRQVGDWGRFWIGADAKLFSNAVESAWAQTLTHTTHHAHMAQFRAIVFPPFSHGINPCSPSQNKCGISTQTF